MAEHTTTSTELRILELERRLGMLTQAIQSVKNTAGAGAEAQAMQVQPPQQPTIFNVITTSAVTARSGTTMGSGSFQFVDPASATLTTLTSGGTYTGYTDSVTGWATGKYGRVYQDVYGQWQFVTADAC